MKVLLGLFLMAHGLIHASYLTPKPDDPKYPFSFDKSWFASWAGHASSAIGSTLAALAVACFVLAGLAVLGVPGLKDMWKFFTVTGAISSLLLLVLFWHRWLVLGVVIDIALVAGIYLMHWSFAKV